jgi:hypothetical protein
MALNTSKKITCYSWDEILTPNAVIDRVNKLGQDQPEQLIFTNCHGNLIGDDKAPGVVPEYPPDRMDEVQDQDDYVKIPGVDDNVGIPGVDVGTEQETQDPQIIEIDDPNTVHTDPLHIKPDTDLLPAPNSFDTQYEAAAMPPMPTTAPVAPPEPAPVNIQPV